MHADIDEGLYVGNRPPRVDPWDEHEPGVSRTTRRGMAQRRSEWRSMSVRA